MAKIALFASGAQVIESGEILNFCAKFAACARAKFVSRRCQCAVKFEMCFNQFSGVTFVIIVLKIHSIPEWFCSKLVYRRSSFYC